MFQSLSSSDQQKRDRMCRLKEHFRHSYWERRYFVVISSFVDTLVKVCHLRDPQQVALQRTVSAMKGQEKNESTSLVAIYQQETAALPANVAAALASFVSLDTTWYCRRQQRYPLLLNSGEDIDIRSSFEQQAQESGSSSRPSAMETEFLYL